MDTDDLARYQDAIRRLKAEQPRDPTAESAGDYWRRIKLEALARVQRRSEFAHELEASRVSKTGKLLARNKDKYTR
jgi:hypothetical protein